MSRPSLLPNSTWTWDPLYHMKGDGKSRMGSHETVATVSDLDFPDPVFYDYVIMDYDYVRDYDMCYSDSWTWYVKVSLVSSK